MDLQQNSNYSLSTRRSLTAKTMSALNCENCKRAHSKAGQKKDGASRVNERAAGMQDGDEYKDR